ncbi:fimbrial biogenesis outer membrane usher protein [Sphingomonas sp. GCM10030256]|uniref:fimbrial biogenesis outer membrane usher protein n=1 Tax=Sphingomonas sp. GCM10030256 TaxID=3273427 RepID=UPI003614B2FE
MRAVRLLLLGSVATQLLLPQAAGAADVATAAAPAAAVAQLVLPADPGAGDINPTQGPVTLTVPLRDAGRYIGDVVVDITPDDRVSLSSARLFQLIGGTLDRKLVEQLGAKPRLGPDDLAEAGIRLRYNAQDLALDLELAADRRAVRGLQVALLDQETVGNVIAPARVSAYLNARGNFDYLHGDAGFAAPLIALDGAARIAGVVAEGEGLWRPGGDGVVFTRVGSRLVYDDRDRLMRWTLGDLQPIGRGFQALPEIAGLSVFRSYGVLEPQRIARPRGGRAFTLSRPSTVDVQVNGQLVRRLQLEPGNYDLRDFPFTQGANDVRLTIRDDGGRTQALSFNVFLDQTQLGSGLTEFGAYAGVLAPSGFRGPEYSRSLAASGFLRHGFSDRLTAGLNLQGDGRAQMGGVEAIWSSPLGTFGSTLSLSNVRELGLGSAVLVTFQRQFQREGGGADSLNLFAERRSRNFGVLGTLSPLNPFAWEVGGGYSRTLGRSIFAGLDGRYSRGRDDQPTIYNARGTIGYRLSSDVSLAGEIRYEKDNVERRVSGLLTATMRLGRSSNLRADYDTRFNRARLSYSSFQGYGVGSYNLSADLDRSDSGSGANINAGYLANRAEFGFSHYGSFDNLFGSSVSQRTSLRVGGSLAFADGSVSIGRPVSDSFALVAGHGSLKGASVEVDRSPFGYVAETGALGTAVAPSLASYIDRTVVVDAPDAPVTVDLGQGSFRLRPAYRSGYKLIVGSANNVTAVGRLLDAGGQPLSLISGSAIPVDQPQAEPTALFTNREGRFGASGLAPGRWRITMNDDAGSTFVIDIGRNAEGVLSLGELKPSGTAGKQDN